MKRMLALFALALAAVVAHPVAARAQCNEACVFFFTPDGASGYGCVVDNDSGAACYARSTRCYTKLCSNALVTDPSGHILAVADICNGQVTLRPAARERAQRRTARFHPARGTATATASRARTVAKPG
jgi:hypothetical protein